MGSQTEKIRLLSLKAFSGVGTCLAAAMNMNMRLFLLGLSVVAQMAASTEDVGVEKSSEQYTTTSMPLEAMQMETTLGAMQMETTLEAMQMERAMYSTAPDTTTATTTTTASCGSLRGSSGCPPAGRRR